MNEASPVTGEEGRTARPVFISYATTDRKDALAICDAIERRGTKCWISQRDVEPGDNYQEAIVRSLRNARAMVLVFSDAANNSDEIKKELSLASRYHVTVMALRIEDVEPSDAFAYELSTRQWIDAFEGWDRSIDSLVHRLEQIECPASKSSAAPAVSPRRRASPAGRRGVLALGAAVLLLALLAGGWWLFRPTPAAPHSMMVRLAGFRLLSNDLPTTMPETISEEIIAAFSADGVIGVSTATSPPAGNMPAYSLGGTVRSEGNKVRVITKLTNERSGATLWSNDYTYDQKLISRVPRFIAVEAGSIVRCGLFGASTYPRTLPDPILADYLQACQGTVKAHDPARGLDFARKVVAAAPKFSWGWSVLAIAAHESTFRAETPAEADALRKEGLRAADAAIRLDRTNSEALAFKSAMIDSVDLVAREELMQRAMKARPLACGCEHMLHGWLLYEVGRINDAMAQFRRSTEVIALDADSQFALGEALANVGNLEEAKGHFEAGIELSSDPTIAQQVALWYAPFTGDYEAALEAARDPNVSLPAKLRPALMASYRALLSKDPVARSRAVAQLLSTPAGTNNVLIIPLLGALGANREALGRVEDAVARRQPSAASYLFVPSMVGALHEPGFPALAERLGLMSYWKETGKRPDVCSRKTAPPFCRMI
ncbi:MAG TPA: TIR domain-containing protein [Sphingomicrobium sp.]|nr:TIR domain-containing protein [Sphingomicrobium sp.]